MKMNDPMKRGDYPNMRVKKKSFYDIAALRYRHAGKAYTPDEILNRKGADRVTLSDDPGLPCDEIMIALQHHARMYDIHMDHSTLVALAMYCEEELDKAIGENGHLMYAQTREDEDS